MSLYLRTFGGLCVVPAADGNALTQRRRLALLALLADAGSRGLSRNAACRFLWRSDDEPRHRAALAQALYAIRHAVGASDAILGTTVLRLNGSHLSSDLGDFRRALAEGRPADAVRLYTGPFLDGFYVGSVPTFERWAEETRVALAGDHVAALERLAESARTTGDVDGAVTWRRALAEAEPLSSRAAVALMNALVAARNPALALREAAAYALRVREELGEVPDRAVTDLAATLRQAARVEPALARPPASGSGGAPLE